jgi:hypothetical protein
MAKWYDRFENMVENKLNISIEGFWVIAGGVAVIMVIIANMPWGM